MLRAVVFDLDGTLYKGEREIKGAKETVEKIRKMGYLVFFLSNSGTNKREDILKKLQSFGIRANINEIYSSCYGAGRYILENYGKGTRFYAIAEKSAIEEIESFGLIFDSERAKAVIVSLDRSVSYDKIAKAYHLIKKGATFIATNKDAEYPVESGTMPGAGAIVASVEAAAGKKPLLIGKPSTLMLDWLTKDNGLRKDDILLVGDSIITDVALAKKARTKCALVLSGLVKKAEAKKANADFVINSVFQLPKVLSQM
ncbi:MAG: HAD-IIA family hydrolase [Candidatus Bilamarchaeaceae archaeon]